MKTKRDNFAAIPNIADDDLDPFEYRLYGHYKRVCGEKNKPCRETNRETAAITKMSSGMVTKTRNRLADKGWIVVDGTKRNPIVTMANAWILNSQRYPDRSPREQGRSPDEQIVHGVNNSFTTRTKRSPGEQIVHGVNEHNNVVKESKSLRVEDGKNSATSPNIFTAWTKAGGKSGPVITDHLIDLETTFGTEHAIKCIGIAGRAKKGNLTINYVWEICESRKKRDAERVARNEPVRPRLKRITAADLPPLPSPEERAKAQAVLNKGWRNVAASK